MRKILLLFLVLLTGIIFIGRLFYLQVYNTSFNNLSKNNAVKIVYDYPQRGHIFDRNGVLLVSNQPSYDVMGVPRDIQPLDTLEFCKLLKISKETFLLKLKKAKKRSSRLPYVVIPQLTKAEFASLSEKMYKYKGFYIQKRSLRDYQVTHSANVLGYVSEVNERIVKDNPYYQIGEIIGTGAVEAQYEKVLRGVKGVKFIQKDRFNRDIGPYKKGRFDTLPVRGRDIVLTIDSKLQEYGEQLMKNKRGGIVALEPATGEILALIAAPNYNPSLLVGRERSKNYTKLWYDTLSKPLFDRVLQGEYPPGSPFKALTSLIGLQEGVINKKEKIYCYGSYDYGGRKPLGCHIHSKPLKMAGGIANSCNSYFATVYLRTINKYSNVKEGINHWREHLLSFGLGNYMGHDLPSGSKGLIPSSKYYDRYYPNSRWYAPATISNAIGQGEILMTPMQMANFTSAIANRGYFYRPHVLRNIVGVDTIPKKYLQKHQTSIEVQHFAPVIEGLFDVYNYGTAKNLKIKGIEICGKTGTAENFAKINGERIQLKDHSVFVAFAPKENPKITLAVFVENGGYGSEWAGPITSLMIEKYLKNSITRADLETKVLHGSLEEEYKKLFSRDSTKLTHNE